MATYTFNADTYAEQVAALENSSLLVRDGTKLTGNVQVAVASWEAAGTYADGDVITIPLAILPKGARLLPALCGCTTTAGGTYTFGITECTNNVGILTGDQASNNTEPSGLTEDLALTTEPCTIQAEFTLGAALPANFKAFFTIAYAATS